MKLTLKDFGSIISLFICVVCIEGCEKINSSNDQTDANTNNAVISNDIAYDEAIKKLKDEEASFEKGLEDFRKAQGTIKPVNP